MKHYWHLGQILIQLNVISHQQVIEARKRQLSDHPTKPLGQILLDLDYITNDDLLRALSLQKDRNA